jgi:hypothetical protein
MTVTQRQRGPDAKNLDQRSVLALELLFNETVCFLLKAGLTRTRVLKLLKQNARKIDGRTRAKVPRVIAVHGWYQDIAEVAANVVADWHREPRYTDDMGEPLALDEASMKQLLEARCGRKNVVRTLVSLCKNGIIQQNKAELYVLRSSMRAALFSAREAVLVRAAVVVPEILGAALRNARVPSPDLREVNRTVQVRHLPKKYLPLWRQLTRERTQAFLEGLDNWLEDHNDPQSPERTVAVGLHVCACAARSGTSNLPRARAGSEVPIWSRTGTSVLPRGDDKII